MIPETVRPNAYVALRLPSDTLTVVQALPNTSISIGKYGSFRTNDIIGRPYYLTFEILDKADIKKPAQSGLRVVSAAELYANIDDDGSATPSEKPDGTTKNDGVEYEVVGEDGKVVMRTNRQIIDDPNSQVMTMEQIETLKAENTGSGKEIIAKILDSHLALDQKTAFALAKYTLRKTKKYLRRFTMLPLDVPMLVRYVLAEKEPLKILDMREEILALIGSWSNIHHTPSDPALRTDEAFAAVGRGRWLVVDETSGLLVAYMAEKMGLLYPSDEDGQDEKLAQASKQNNGQLPKSGEGDHPMPDVSAKPEDATLDEVEAAPQEQPASTHHTPKRPHKRSASMSTTNTLTVIHSAAQPNLSLLQYFQFDAVSPSPSHPLAHHLKVLSWLQLLCPEEDAGYTEPAAASPEELSSWKSGRRSSYYRKRRRWERIKSTVDETRAGGFDGLIVASVMDPVSILRHTVPLLRGGAQVVVYSPTLESLTQLADYYSSARRTAFLNDPPEDGGPTEDFPVQPTLLLAPTIQTARCRSWQVLPGRTHPLMTGRGGSEGYVFTGTRVLPAEGKVEARGKWNKKRKVGAGSADSTPQGGTPGAV